MARFAWNLVDWRLRRPDTQGCRQLRLKEAEYLMRIELYRLQAEGDDAFDTYLVHLNFRVLIIQELLKRGSVDLRLFATSLRKQGRLDDSTELLYIGAAGIVQDYVLTGGRLLRSGTGLPECH